MPVSFTQWISESVDHLQNGDSPLLKRMFRPVYFAYVGSLLTAANRISIGTNIYERDWDLLIVLDACRLDAIEKVQDEYDFLRQVNSIWSVGSTSFEWMPLTFRNKYLDEIERTAYITGNPYTERVFEEKRNPPVRDSIPFGPTDYDVVDSESFQYLEELWKYNFEDSFNRLPPRFTTDRAVSAGREINADRFIIHYMYPHDPYPLAEEGLRKPFEKLMAGQVSRGVVWDLYIENLRYVLEEVELLLENFEANKVIITADHGEAFGEYGFYAHEIGCPLPSVRRVPWVVTTAKDSGEYIPDEHEEKMSNKNTTAEKRLKDLGYL